MMDDKRTVLAIVLSILVLLAWTPFARYMGWVKPKEPVSQQITETLPAPSGTAQQAAPASPGTNPLPVFTASEGREIKVETPLYSAVIHSGGGVLRSFILKNYDSTMDEGSPKVNLVTAEAAKTAPMGMTVNGQPSWSTGTWSFRGGDLNLAAGQTGELTFVGVVDGIRVTRVLSFTADNYLITEKSLIGSEDKAPHNVRLGFMVSATPFSAGRYDITRLAWNENGSYDDEADGQDLAEKGIMAQGTFPWAGVMSNYFMNAVAPRQDTNLTLKGRVQGDVWRLALETPEQLTPTNGEFSVAASWWFGPKDRHLLSEAPNDLKSAIHYGFFSVISRPLLVVLDFFHGYVVNWGIAIILLTCCIRIVFWPLSRKSYRSMQMMNKLKPMTEKLREKYKDDKQALNREMMQLYKTYKVNPAGGCLPILVQIPVFIGLYQALMNALELRHAVFIKFLPFTDKLWLADLSAADPYYISPILMGGTMLLQQKLTPAAGDPMQQKMMMLMPIIFTAMFLNFPAGLVVYWLSNNVLSIAQQWWSLRETLPSLEEKKDSNQGTPASRG